MKPLHTGPAGLALMHYYEGVQLIAYPDPASELFRALGRDGVDPYRLSNGVPPKYKALSGAPWTIGRGETKNVRPGMQVTMLEAERMFSQRLARDFEPGVEDALQQEPLPCEFDAFVSLAYNIGVANFRSSTALRKFNQGDKAGAAAGILMWNKAGGQVMLGLRRRRLAESLVFGGRPAAEAIEAAKRLN